MNNTKFHLHCRKCGADIPGFKEWFANNQKCPHCGGTYVDVKYHRDYSELKKLIDTKEHVENVWHYFDFLPLIDKKNEISHTEGAIPVDRWEFMEKFAKKYYNLDITVRAYRNDLNQGTGTFKDVAGAVTASVLKENGVKDYCVASTGNIANAFAHYFAEAGINLGVFVPEDTLKINEAEINTYGQGLFRVKGDYAMAKKVAADYSAKYGILISGGNTDPMRVEAKKTMVFEWLRQMGKLPTVYIQAVSGGTGPIAIAKGCADLEGLGYDNRLPRFIMVQPSGCTPMVEGYAKAKAAGFPEGWHNDYPCYENPKTSVPILATGKPGTFPIVASLVKESGGDFVAFDEQYLADIAKLVAYETTVRIGPAAAVCVGGFFESLKNGLLKNGDDVLINLGEGSRRAPAFVESIIYTTKHVASVDECEKFDRSKFEPMLWDKILKIYNL